MMLALAPIPEISAAPTIAKKPIVIKETAPCAAARAKKIRPPAEMHFAPIDMYDLRRLAGFVTDTKNPDMIGRGDFQMLERKPHRRLSQCLGQHVDIDNPAHVVGNRMQAHDWLCT